VGTTEALQQRSLAATEPAAMVIAEPNSLFSYQARSSWMSWPAMMTCRGAETRLDRRIGEGRVLWQAAHVPSNFLAGHVILRGSYVVLFTFKVAFAQPKPMSWHALAMVAEAWARNGDLDVRSVSVWVSACERGSPTYLLGDGRRLPLDKSCRHLGGLGHEVLVMDQDPIATVAKGEIPFHDPGPELRLGESLGTGRLSFTASRIEQATGHVEFRGYEGGCLRH
jgi:hypothetical protein